MNFPELTDNALTPLARLKIWDKIRTKQADKIAKEWDKKELWDFFGYESLEDCAKWLSDNKALVTRIVRKYHFERPSDDEE